ncbi:MAG: cyanophycin synthetase [Patescibacteria group bacterium]
MKKKSQTSLLGNILQKVAPKIGATVLMEPEWGVVGQITFKSGKKSYTRYNTVDMNSIGSSDVARDKDYANFFMKRMGYPVVEGKTFFSKTWARAIGSKRNIDTGYKYAKKLGFPIVVKPNSGSQGVGVALVSNKQEFYRAMRFVFKGDKVALVQKYLVGKDYRIVVLDKKIISAYERIPLSVMGDGKLSIEKLLNKKKKYFNNINRDIKIDTKDSRIKEKLKRQKLSLKSVLPKGKLVYLLDNANLSTGGDSVDVTNAIHPLFKKLAVKLTSDMGLRLCGVDLMIVGNIKEKPNKYWVLEVNAAPGLDHYVTTGKAQQKIVEDLYLEVLKSMDK